ncbi:PE family protein [Mycobacterium tuberculosis]|uniref:PE family protein n=1 Tax=Mycobacterium tuberculosis TaxID=1773 RepID=UPI0032B531E7
MARPTRRQPVTTQVLAAGADEVSARLVALFGGFGLEYQVTGAGGGLPPAVCAGLSTGAGAYARSRPAAAEQIAG